MSKNNWYNYSDRAKRLQARLAALEAELEATTDEGRKELLMNEIQTILKELQQCK